MNCYKQITWIVTSRKKNKHENSSYDWNHFQKEAVLAARKSIHRKTSRQLQNQCSTSLLLSLQMRPAKQPRKHHRETWAAAPRAPHPPVYRDSPACPQPSPPQVVVPALARHLSALGKLLTLVRLREALVRLARSRQLANPRTKRKCWSHVMWKSLDGASYRKQVDCAVEEVLGKVNKRSCQSRWIFHVREFRANQQWSDHFRKWLTMNQDFWRLPTVRARLWKKSANFIWIC